MARGTTCPDLLSIDAHGSLCSILILPLASVAAAAGHSAGDARRAPVPVLTRADGAEPCVFVRVDAARGLPRVDGRGVSPQWAVDLPTHLCRLPRMSAHPRAG